MSKHLSLAELEQHLPDILDTPKDNGELKLISTRPVSGERVLYDKIELTVEEGVIGDKWSYDCWLTLEDGSPDPEVQVTIINSRSINAIAQQQDRWSLSGDNFFVEMFLGKNNLKTGDRLKLGSSILEITEEPHLACLKFANRYGRDANRFVNSQRGRELRLRGIHAKIVSDGFACVGDKLSKL